MFALNDNNDKFIPSQFNNDWERMDILNNGRKIQFHDLKALSTSAIYS